MQSGFWSENMKIIFRDKKVTIHSDTLGTIEAIPDTYRDNITKDSRVLTFKVNWEE
jgi:hypothetical protein